MSVLHQPDSTVGRAALLIFHEPSHRTINKRGACMTSPRDIPGACAHLEAKNEERREWLRIDDRLLLEYRLVDEPAEAMHLHLPPATEDTIATAVSKPTLDL